MNYIFLMDPLEIADFDKDTSFTLMVEAKRRGHRVFFLPEGGITRVKDHFEFQVIEVKPQLVRSKPFVIVKKNLTLADRDVDVIFIRTDPPFDNEYLVQTWLCDLLPKRIVVINDARGIRDVNEKIWASQFTEIIPPTLIGRTRESILNFIRQEKIVIAKPTDGHGGKSVFRIKHGDKNTNVILETITSFWTRDIILQKYVAASKKGDKRILLLNGEPLGAILRVHARNDYRNNIFAGGKAVATKITRNDLKIISILKPRLQSNGLYFVGIDILGDYLIEVSVTSPTCLQEMNQIYGLHLEKDVISFTEKLVEQRR